MRYVSESSAHLEEVMDSFVDVFCSGDMISAEQLCSCFGEKYVYPLKMLYLERSSVLGLQVARDGKGLLWSRCVGKEIAFPFHTPTRREVFLGRVV